MVCTTAQRSVFKMGSHMVSADDMSYHLTLLHRACSLALYLSRTLKLKSQPDCICVLVSHRLMPTPKYDHTLLIADGTTQQPTN